MAPAAEPSRSYRAVGSSFIAAGLAASESTSSSLSVAGRSSDLTRTRGAERGLFASSSLTSDTEGFNWRESAEAAKRVGATPRGAGMGDCISSDIGIASSDASSSPNDSRGPGKTARSLTRRARCGLPCPRPNSTPLGPPRTCATMSSSDSLKPLDVSGRPASTLFSACTCG